MAGAIVIVGSLNMDFVAGVDHLPGPGETVSGSSFQMIPGGKGANQACAAGRLAQPGTEVRMIGRVGSDMFADQLKTSLAAAGVDVSAVHPSKTAPTGTALIVVDKSGQNSIVVVPGANDQLSAGEAERLKSSLAGAEWALFQLETPVETVEAYLRLARSCDVRTILDPAPARKLSRELLGLVDILTPNESEACQLLGRQPVDITPSAAPRWAAEVLELGARSVVLKLGEGGCYYTNGRRELYAPGFGVTAVDTTAAGDTFNGALAVALSEDLALADALRFANAAAAISVTRQGAQTSTPSRAEVDAMLSANAR